MKHKAKQRQRKREVMSEEEYRRARMYGAQRYTNIQGHIQANRKRHIILP